MEITNFYEDFIFSEIRNYPYISTTARLALSLSTLPTRNNTPLTYDQQKIANNIEQVRLQLQKLKGLALIENTEFREFLKVLKIAMIIQTDSVSFLSAVSQIVEFIQYKSPFSSSSELNNSRHWGIEYA